MRQQLYKYFILFFVITTTITGTVLPAQAQDAATVPVTTKPARTRNYDQVSMGLGLGLDYGGFGGNLLCYPLRNVGIFGGAGYALIGLGYNAGIKLRFLSKRSDPGPTPYLIGMYGYNTAIKIKGAEQYNKLFYGPTVGFGLDTRYKTQKVGYWSFALLLPIRSESDKYMDELTAYHGVHFDSRPSAVAISIGFHFVFHQQ